VSANASWRTRFQESEMFDWILIALGAGLVLWLALFLTLKWLFRNHPK